MNDEQMIGSGSWWTAKPATALMAVLVVLTLIVLKAIAYQQSGSVSILTSLTDSVLDSLVSIMAFGSIIYAQQPADDDHRWGHGKIEAVSAMVQSSIIFGGSAFLIFEGVNRMVTPRPISEHWLSIAVMCVSTVLSAILVFWQLE